MVPGLLWQGLEINSEGLSAEFSEVLHRCSCPFVCVAVVSVCTEEYTQVCETVWVVKAFFLQEVFGRDYSCIYLLVSSAEMKSYQLLPPIN